MTGGLEARGRITAVVVLSLEEAYVSLEGAAKCACRSSLLVSVAS